MKLKILITILFTTATLSSNSQTKEQFIKSICDSLLILETGSAEINCISEPETGMWLSCFSISGKPEWIADFNGDGEDDLLLHFTDEGMGGGGNAFVFDYRAVLMKNGAIDEIHSIFGGGKLSYGHLEIKKIENGKIYAVCEENPFSKSDLYDDIPLNKINLVFEYKDGLMQEQSYARCSIADMDKSVFNYITPYTVDRWTGTNELFEVEQQEKLYIGSDDDYILATLDGCKSVNLRFSYNIPYSDFIENPVLSKEAILSFLRVLQENTRYNSILTLLIKRVENTEILESGEYSIINTRYTLPGSWNASLSMSTVAMDDNPFINMILRLNKNDDETSGYFWDEIKR